MEDLEVLLEDLRQRTFGRGKTVSDLIAAINEQTFGESEASKLLFGENNADDCAEECGRWVLQKLQNDLDTWISECQELVSVLRRILNGGSRYDGDRKGRRMICLEKAPAAECGELLRELQEQTVRSNQCIEQAVCQQTGSLLGHQIEEKAKRCLEEGEQLAELYGRAQTAIHVMMNCYAVEEDQCFAPWRWDEAEHIPVTQRALEDTHTSDYVIAPSSPAKSHPDLEKALDLDSWLESDRGEEVPAPAWGSFQSPNTSNEPAHPAPVPGVPAPLPYIDEQKKPVEIQKVEFSCLAPKTLARGDYTIIQVIMYEPLYRHIVEEMRAEMEEPAQEKRSGMHEISTNSEIRVVLSSPDFAIEDNTETGIWRGEHLDFSFAVMLPEEYRKRQVLFIAMVYVNDFIATKLKFVVKCTAPSQQEAEVTREDILSAFVSYASQDRGRVAAIIQGMQKARPDMDVFFDVDSLRSGEDWEAALHREIEKRDVLFLCWSQFARKSKWVEAEWRYALDSKGLDCIEPVPIEPPDVCPPPEELSKKHFNDKLLFIIGAQSNNESAFDCWDDWW